MKEKLFWILSLLGLSGIVSFAAIGPGSGTNRLYMQYTGPSDANWIEIAGDNALGQARISSGRAGASKPLRPLMLSGNGTTLMLIVNTNGNVGINTNNPISQLQVHGNMRVASNTYVGHALIASSNLIIGWSSVAGTASAGSNYVSGGMKVDGVATFISDANIGGTANVTGDITTYANQSVLGTLGVGNVATFSNDVNVGGTISGDGSGLTNLTGVTGTAQTNALAVGSTNSAAPAFSSTALPGHDTNIAQVVGTNGSVVWAVAEDSSVNQYGASGVGFALVAYDATGTNTSTIQSTNTGSGTNRVIDLPIQSGTILASPSPLLVGTITDGQFLTLTGTTIGSAVPPDTTAIVTAGTNTLVVSNAGPSFQVSALPGISVAAGTNVVLVTNGYVVTVNATASGSGSSLAETNILIDSTDAAVLDLAAYDVFRLTLLTNATIVFSNQAAGIDALVYFQQPTEGFKLLSAYSVAGGIVQTSAPMTLTTNGDGLDLLEVKSGFFTTNLMVYWPQDFQPRIAFTNTLPSYGSITISNDTYSVAEDGGSVLLHVQRTGGTDGSVSVDVWTANGTAEAGSDYTATNTTFSWGAGESDTKPFSVAIINDEDLDPDETFTVWLSNKVSASWGTYTNATVTITDNDVAPEAGQIVSITVQTNGWQAAVRMYQMPTNGNYDYGFAGSTNNVYDVTNVLLTVSSPGFDDTGASNRQTRYVMGTKTVRYPYPDHANTNCISTNGGYVTASIALSDFIGWDDTITAAVATNWYSGASYGNIATSGLAVANNSICGYGDVIAQWGLPPYRMVTNDTYDLSMFAFHRAGRDGRPVRCVKFWSISASGATNDPVVVTTLDTNGIGEAVFTMDYKGTMQATNFLSGENITNHFAAYPWIGTSTEVYDTIAKGYPPDYVFAGPYKLLCNRSNDYGLSVCIVDPTNGTTAGTVMTNIADALSSPPTPFISIASALNAIATNNNALFGRNDLGNGLIWLTNGEFQMYTNGSGTGGFTSKSDAKTWCHITRHPNVSSNDVVLGTNSTTSVIMNYMKFRISEITLDPESGANAICRNGFYWFDYVNLLTNSGGFSLVYAGTNHWITRSYIDGSLADWDNIDAGSLRDNWFFRGNHFHGLRNSIEGFGLFVGNLSLPPTNAMFLLQNSTASGWASYDRPIIAFNKLYRCDSPRGVPLSIGTLENFTNGVAVIQNLVENVDPGNGRIAQFGQGAVSTITKTANILAWHNTIVGEGTLDRYNQGATNNNYVDTDTLCRYVGNIYTDYATKHDSFTDPQPDGNRTNRWTVVYQVGMIGNACGGLMGDASFLPESSLNNGFNGISTVYRVLTSNNIATAFAFVDPEYYDRVSETDYPGYGDYHMGSDSIAADIVPVLVLPYDLDGQPRTTNSPAGAYILAP